MSKTAKKITAFLLSIIMVLAAAFIAIPPVKAAAVSEVITYKLTYTTKYAKLKLTPRNSSNTIYYTTNGTQPTTASKKYTGTLAASKSVLVRAAEYNKSGSKVATIRLTLCPRVLTPDISVSTSGGVKYLTVMTATPDAVIYYTTDGTVPTKNSRKYTGAVRYTSGAVYVFRGFKTGFTSSQSIAYSDEDEVEEEEIEAKEETPAGFTATADQERVLKLMNEERAAAGAGTLTLDETLCKAAAVRAEEISRKFSHERPDGTRYVAVLESLGIINKASAENIAEGYLTADEVMKGWMNSSGHRRNILNSTYTHIGIAKYTVGGRSYWVQIFGAL